jgi:hypothetical protein
VAVDPVAVDPVAVDPVAVVSLGQAVAAWLDHLEGSCLLAALCQRVVVVAEL